MRLLFLCCALASAAEIPKGSHVLLEMVNSVDTHTAREGDYVYLRTASPIATGGSIVVPVGSHVQGVVTQAKPSGRVKGRAQLAIRLDTLTLPTGSLVKFTPKVVSVDGGDSGQRVAGDEGSVRQAPGKMEDAGQIAILAGSGASIGALADRSWKGAGIGAGIGTGVGIARVLLSKGREVQLKRGTSLDVVFDRAVSLE
jgi:hypothetical protein